MVLIKWYIYHYLFLILFLYKTNAMYSIQCCTSNDNTCSSKPVDCPSNICFKLVYKVTEERGCLDDLIKLLNFANKGSRIFSEGYLLSSGSSNDQCHKFGAQTNEMSLCKCTSNLCNSSTKQIHLKKPILIFIILILQYSLRVFLS